MTAAKKTSLENKYLGNGDYFVITASSSHALLATFRLEYVVDRARCKWTGRSTVEVNIEDERFTVVVCSIVVNALNLKISRCHLADYVKELY